MKRLTLKQPVTITGSSPASNRLFKSPQMIVMRPLTLSEAQTTRSKDGMGWYWQTSDGALVPIDMSLVREEKETRAKDVPELKFHFLHYLYFQRGAEQLKCVEHILALQMLGLDGVVIEPQKGSTWVPYDGRAKLYWETIQDHLKEDGHLRPMKMHLRHKYEDIDPRFGWQRNVIWDNTGGSNELAVQVTIDYPKLGGEQVIRRILPVDDPSSMEDILDARSLEQPWTQKAKPIIEILGWPHAANILKRSTFNPVEPDPFKHEIALHRMLDLLGAAALLLTEAGTYVVGRLETDKGGHYTDLRMLQGIKAVAREKYPELECLARPEPLPPAASRFSLWPAFKKSDLRKEI